MAAFRELQEELGKFDLNSSVVSNFASARQQVIETLKTPQLRSPTAKDRAALATLESKFAQYALDAKDLNAVYCDPKSLLKGKTFYGKLLEMLAGKALHLTLVTADIENFKLVKDNWSHAHGDSAIMQVATCISKHVKDRISEDLICIPFRFAGTEFLFAFISGREVEAEQKISQCLKELGSAVASELLEDFSFARSPPTSDDQNEPERAVGPELRFGCQKACNCLGKELWQLHQLLGDESCKESEEEADARYQPILTTKHKIQALVAMLIRGTEGDQERAAGALPNLAFKNHDNKMSIAGSGGIPPLVALLKSSNLLLQQGALAAIQSLTWHEDLVISIAKAGAIEPLAELLQSSNSMFQVMAAEALGNLAVNGDNVAAILKCNAVAPLVDLLKGGSSAAEERAAKALRNLTVSACNKVSMDSDAIQHLVEVLTNGTAAAKENAAGTLRNLAARDDKVPIVTSGAIAPLVELLRNGTPVAKENAAGVLTHLARHGDNRALIAEACAIEALVELLKSSKRLAAKERAVSALQNLASTSENRISIAKAGAIEPLVRLLSSASPVLQERAVGALANLAMNGENKVAMANSGAIAPLVQLLQKCTPVAKENAVAALLNLAVNGENMLGIVKAGAVPPLVELLRHGSQMAKEKAAAALWNLSAHDENKWQPLL